MPRRSLSEQSGTFERQRPPRRGEVYWVAFGTAIGGEIRKTRPAIVVEQATGIGQGDRGPFNRHNAPFVTGSRLGYDRPASSDSRQFG